MGCGASKTAEEGTREGKYSKGTDRDNANKTAPSHSKQQQQPGSPTTKGKDGKALPLHSPKSAGAPATAALPQTLLAPPPLLLEDTLLAAVKSTVKKFDAITTVEYTHPVYSVKLRSSPIPFKGESEQLVDFGGIAVGGLSVRRPAPPWSVEESNDDDVDAVVTITTEFGGNFTVVLSREEREFVARTTLQEFLDGYVSADDPIVKRFVKKIAGTALPASDSDTALVTPGVPFLDCTKRSPRASIDNTNVSPRSKTKKNGKGACQDMRRALSAFVSQRIVQARLVPAKVTALTIRCIASSPRAIHSIAISADEKVAAFSCVEGPALKPRRHNSSINLPKPKKVNMSEALASITLSVSVIDVRTSRPLYTFKDEDCAEVPYRQLCFSADGQYIYSSSTEGITTWDANKRKKTGSVTYGGDYDPPLDVYASDMSVAAKLYVIAGESCMSTGEVGVFRDGKQSYVVLHDSVATAVALTSTGRHCVSADDIGGIKFWETEAGATVAEIHSHVLAVLSLTFITDNILISVDADHIRAWHIPDLDVKGDTEEPLSAQIRPLWTVFKGQPDVPVPYVEGESMKLPEGDRERAGTFVRAVVLPGGLLGVSTLSKEVCRALRCGVVWWETTQSSIFEVPTLKGPAQSLIFLIGPMKLTREMLWSFSNSPVLHGK